MCEPSTSPVELDENGNTHNNIYPNRTLSKKYESLDYDLIENVLHLEYQHKSRFNKFITRDLQRWLVIFLIGFSAAMSGFMASFAVNYLTRLKFSHIIHFSEQYCSNNQRIVYTNSTTEQDQLDSTSITTNLDLIKCIWIPYLFWLAWNIIPSLFGALIVTYISPIAAGSGIPVVKCYLNGVKIPDVVHLKTYLVKLFGVIASVVGGLAVGKEGPFIHCGAALGAGISQGKSTAFNFDTKLFKSFRNDRDKRDFVSAGASAGVAAAFGAPIGGVLFALEEGASFWNQALTWRIFFCSMMTSFTLNLLMSAYNNNAGVLAFYSLVNFGLVEELDYFWFEIPVYICIAICGGIIGASFCYTNLLITKWRKQYVDKRWKKIIETVLVAVLTATIGVLLILFASDCRPLPKTTSLYSGSTSTQVNKEILNYDLYSPKRLWSSKSQNTTYEPDDVETKAIKGHVITFMCPPGQYSAMSSLWLKTSEGASSTFMVLQEDIWSIKTLSLFMVVYYFLAVLTYGLSISSGVFIPSLLIGATGGRLVGLILRHFFGPLVWLNQLNKFAIIGASSVLGGVVRMTISLTVIIIEATGCISFGLPIMICLMVSKWVADSFIEGLYDLAIHLANVPFLDWEPPIRSYSIYASDVMSHNVKILRTTETVASLVTILKSTTHNGFPVVDFDTDLNDSKNIPSTPFSGDYYTPNETPTHSRVKNLFSSSQPHEGTSSDTTQLVTESIDTNDDSLIGSFQRCSITAKRDAYGRFRGLVLRWQLLVMLQLRIFNENERSFEMLSLPSFQKLYPRYPSLDQVMAGLTPEMYHYHVDLRAIMSPTPYNVLYSASFPRIYRLFRSLGLRHLVVIDDRNQVVGMITRKDLARYVRKRDENGSFKFYELKYSS